MMWYKGSTPAEITPKPWLAPDVIAKLESLLTPDMDILEHGSGGSTLWFAERVKSVASVEDDVDWYNEVNKIKPANVKLILYQSDGMPVIDGKYDLILIDGEPVYNRAVWLMHAQSLIKPGGIIVLDNCNRPEYETEATILARQAHRMDLYNSDYGKYLNTVFLFMEEH